MPSGGCASRAAGGQSTSANGGCPGTPTARYLKTPAAAGTTPREAERREAALVDAYRTWCERNYGANVFCQHEIALPDGGGKLYTDGFNRATAALIEAKADTTRDCIRMAIGQLADYSRYVPTVRERVLLVPVAPERDLMELLGSVDVHVVVPIANGDFVELEHVPGGTAGSVAVV